MQDKECNMNNKFFVPVLALGIAALGAAASPTQAATATLGYYMDPTTGVIPEWSDHVTMTDASLWDTAAVLESHDGGSYVLVDHVPAGDTGPGTFSVHWQFMPPPSGHTDKYLFQNYIYSKGNTVETNVPAGPGTVTNNNGTFTFDS